jgi:glycosyltransferase involved in cell wall biosynthesis
MPKATTIFTVSETEKSEILKTLPALEDRISVIYNACSNNFTLKPEQSTIASKLKYSLPNEPFYLVHGNTDPKKNTTNTLLAFYHLLKADKLQRKIVLTDISASEVNKIIKKHNLIGLKEHIHLSNYVNHEYMPDLYNRAFMFLYPSIRESFGLPILEAMACGTPVITSNCSCMPEIAGDAAYLADPLDPVSIARGIEKIDTDERYRQDLIEKGSKRSEVFSWSDSTKKLIHLYKTTFHPPLRVVSKMACGSESEKLKQRKAS